MKAHIGPNGPAKCEAESGSCPYAAPSDHFSSLKAANEEYSRRLKDVYGEVASIKKKVKKLSPVEERVRNTTLTLAKKLLESRNLDNVKRPDLIKKRISKSIDFAKENRLDPSIIGKLPEAEVAKTNRFKDSKGKTFTAQSLMDIKNTLGEVDKRREVIETEINNIIQSSNITMGKFTVETSAGKFSATVKDTIDDEQLNSLSKKLRNAISSPSESLSLEKARDLIPAEKLALIVNHSRVTNYLSGSPRDSGVPLVKSRLSGDTPKEKIESGLKNLSEVYESVGKTKGKVRDLKKELSDHNSVLKDNISKDSSVIVPGSARSNNIFVTSRFSIDRKKAAEVLSPNELKSITEVTFKPDEKKAETILSSEAFKKIFRKKVISIRVTESK